MWYVYIILCADNSFYVGSTNNIGQRFLQHQAGIGAKYTRSHRPVSCLYLERLESRGAALRREIKIKSFTRTKKEMLIQESMT